MEGRRFACGWKREGRLFHVWVKRRPKLTASAPTFNQADHRLWVAIMSATGDGESVREYDPPAPAPGPELIEARRLDPAALVKRLEQSTRRRSKPDPLDTNKRIERRFAERVSEHFAFLPDLGLEGPTFSRTYRADTGMTFLARFASRKRTLDISIDKAHKKYPGGADFLVKPVPAGDQFEWFMSIMYLALKHTALGNRLAEFALTHTLDEIMETEFPLFADLFRGELRPLLTAEQWHDEYEFYRV